MGSLPKLAVVGTIVACLGELLHIIGLGTTQWLVGSGIHGSLEYGLFKRCRNGICNFMTDSTGKWRSVQVLTIIGMVCGLVTVAAAVVFVFFKLLDKDPPNILAEVCAVSGMAAGLYIISGITVFGSQIYHDVKSTLHLGYSFGLSTAGGILIYIGGILVVLGLNPADVHSSQIEIEQEPLTQTGDRTSNL